jgi:hypothetical protein
MSKYNLEKTLRKELEILNNEIDRKIIKGLSYAQDAKRHKFIVSSLERLRRENNSRGWFGAFSFARVFTL